MKPQIKTNELVIRLVAMTIITFCLPLETVTAQTASYSQFKQHNKAGLSISLPKEFSKLTEKKQSNEKGTLVTYTAVHETRSLLIKHFQWSPDMQFTTAQAADIQEGDMKNQPRYSSSRKEVTINGIRCLILVMKCEPTMQQTRVKVSRTILYFNKGGHMWEVQIFGVNELDQGSLGSMTNKIFKSVKIVN